MGADVASPDDCPVARDDLVAVLAAARRAGADWAEIYVERRDSETIRLESGHVSEIRSDRDQGVSVRVVTRGRQGHSVTNLLSRAALIEAAATAAAASGASPAAKAATATDLRVRSIKPAQRTTRPFSGVAPSSKVELLEDIDAAVRATDPAIKTVSAVHIGNAQRVWVATSDGNLVSDDRVSTRLTCSATASRDGRVATGFCGKGLGKGMELYDEMPPDLIGSTAGRRAVSALAGIDPPTGRMPVVLGSAGGGLLLHEACGHGLEADGLSRGMSVFSESFGQRVASPLVTAVDDPSLWCHYGSYGMDDEGRQAEETLLIDAGTLRGCLGSRQTPVRGAQAAGANARRQTYAHPPVPRMSNTYIRRGQAPAESIVATVASGVYVATLKGGDVNIVTGEFAFVASEAYLIEHGEVTTPLAGVTLLGNSTTALLSVQAVGDDLGFTEAICGKEGQSVPVSYGSPTLLLDGLTVTGGARG